MTELLVMIKACMGNFGCDNQISINCDVKQFKIFVFPTFNSFFADHQFRLVYTVAVTFTGNS